MKDQLPSPLHTREFFSGIWQGTGSLEFRGALGWLFRKERLSFRSEPTWLSETIWVVDEEFVFDSGHTIRRRMFVTKLAPDRLHVTADDMPAGADILLSRGGFQFTPYTIRSSYRGRVWQVKCLDENRVDDQGTIHDTVRMYFAGIHVATLQLKTRVSRDAPVTHEERERRG